MAVEIEFRGPLGRNEFRNLLGLLAKRGKFIKKTRRTTFVFHTNDKTLDLKIRTTDGISEIVLKKGLWGARKREEIVLPIKARSVKDAQGFLAFLGYNKGIIAVRETSVFEYKSIELSLVKCPKNCYFFEAEFIENRLTKNPEEHIRRVLKSLGLEVWSEKEFCDFLEWGNEKIDRHFIIN